MTINIYFLGLLYTDGDDGGGGGNDDDDDDDDEMI